MTLDRLKAAFSATAKALAAKPNLEQALHRRWRESADKSSSELSEELIWMDQAMPLWSMEASREDVDQLISDEAAPVVTIWCAASTDREDVRLANLVKKLHSLPSEQERALAVAYDRVVQGPIDDALQCAPLLSAEKLFQDAEHREARARMEILLWEAGARAMQIPELGRWIWESEASFGAVVGEPARGNLRRRVFAARCLEVSVCGISPMTDPQLIGRTLQVLQPLLLHPEPLVWIHAARSFGRLAGTFEPLEGTLLDWVHGSSPVLRQRALTAFASLPANRLMVLGHELEAILADPDSSAGVLSAAAAATPYLFHERRKLWEQLAARIMNGDGGAMAARALARGLATLWRRRKDRDELRAPLKRLRHLARRAHSATLDDWRRWIETLAVTDPVEDAERDPLDLERGLENLVRLAAQYDDVEADARAARFASTLAPTFSEAKRVALGGGSVRQRASAILAVEGCARSLALRLWGPMLATHPHSTITSEPSLEEAWELIAGGPEELLEFVRERRTEREREPNREATTLAPKNKIAANKDAVQEGTTSEGATDEDAALALEVLALKLGGYALDATGGDKGDLGPGPGQTAHATCLWLRKLDGLTSGSRGYPPALQNALSALFWRIVDTTRGTALGEVDDVAWLGPFAAWWALVIDRPAILQQLATALPMIREGALDTCCTLAATLRAILSAETEHGSWGPEVQQALTDLHAGDTELAAALNELSTALAGFAKAAGPRPDLETISLALVTAAERLRRALTDPVRALHPVSQAQHDDTLGKALTTNAPRTATMVTRAIRTRQPSLLDVWFVSLGPITAALVESAIQAAVRRTPPPPPRPKAQEPTTLGGYELVKRLGEGGIGSVWLVRKPGADRFFVLKVPKADALESASDTEREGILASFQDEAAALAGLYHPNVANIIDRGIAEGMPYLVLEYLLGADLKQYASASLLTLFELRKLVLESCAGLTALHNAGLVHRDIKPANIWLRLPLEGGQRFDPETHRDPARVPPLSSVIIDFGMVRAMRVPAEVGGRFVAGTPGYIAPEQVLDPVELDGRADVYALAGTIYNVTTGRSFFDEISDARERIIAHMQRDPIENLDPLRNYPTALIKLMRAATDRAWNDRPTPTEFGREFSAAL